MAAVNEKVKKITFVNNAVSQSETEHVVYPEARAG